MTTNNINDNLSKYLDYSSYDDYENLTKEELFKLEVVEEKTISKKICNDKDINISLIALKELEKKGFNSDLSTFVLSKLIEDLYHERKLFNSSNYFDLSFSDNEHYNNLVDYFKLGDNQFFRGLIAKSIGESTCSSKNINDIVYNTINNISFALSSKKLLLDM